MVAPREKLDHTSSLALPLRRLRTRATTPTSPVPSSNIVVGSGMGAAWDGPTGAAKPTICCPPTLILPTRVGAPVSRLTVYSSEKAPLEWGALEGISRPKVLELASGEYIRRAEDVILAGPVGTGKTHLSIALGVEATRHRHRVLFTRAANLGGGE